MDGNRPDALSDEALDRELDAALNVEPSPEFLARLRMRVASEPAAGPWWTSWKLVTVGACVVLLGVAVAVWSRPELTSPAGPSLATDRTLPAAVVAPLSQSAVEPTPRSMAVEPPPTEVSRRVASTDARPRRPLDMTADEIVMTEVIVSEDDLRSLDTLLLAIQQRRLPPLTAEEAPVDESLEPAPIEIADLTIEPVEISRLD